MNIVPANAGIVGCECTAHTMRFGGSKATIRVSVTSEWSSVFPRPSPDLVGQHHPEAAAGARIEVLEVTASCPPAAASDASMPGIGEGAEHFLAQGGDTTGGGIDAHGASIRRDVGGAAAARHPSVGCRAYPEIHGHPTHRPRPRRTGAPSAGGRH